MGDMKLLSLYSLALLLLIRWIWSQRLPGPVYAAVAAVRKLDMKGF